MESVENIAIQTYQNNMNYFSRQHPSLYKLITSFSEMLETEVHSQEYDLEYINGYFDIINLKTSKYVYNENSEDLAQSLADEISFKKNEMVFNNINIKKSSETFLSTLSDKTRSQKSIYELVNYTLDNSYIDDTMNKIEKFIFIGVGLGKQIELVDKKIKSSEYLIIEDNLEFFRLSLFVTKYYEVGQSSKLHFCIAQDENMFTNSMQIFMDSDFVYNKQFKYLHLKTHSQDKIKRIQNTVVSQDFLTFPYGLVMEKHLRALEFINSGYNILDLTEHFDDKLLTTMPVLMLAAGPSFEKNIEWIKANHKKFIIVAVSAILKRLYEIKVKPDIVTHLDGFSASVGYFKDFDAQIFLKDTIFIFEAFTPTVVREMFPKENIFQFEGDTYYSNKKRSISAPCIGSLSLFISLVLNVKELYILGLDLAVNQDTGDTHSQEHFYSDDTDIKNKENFSNTMSLKDTFISVVGNLHKIVYTIPLFTSSINSIYNNIESIKHKEQVVYNLSDGVKLRDTVSLTIENFDRKYSTLDKKKAYISLHSMLVNHSTKKLTIASEESLKKRYDNIRNIKEKLDNTFKNISYRNPDDYMNSLVKLLFFISEGESLESVNIREVYYKYFQYMLPLIVDFFNTKDLKNKKRHIKKIDTCVKKELYLIQNSYEKAIGAFIETEKFKYISFVAAVIKKQQNLIPVSYDSLTSSWISILKKLSENSSGFEREVSVLFDSFYTNIDKFILNNFQNDNLQNLNELLSQELIQMIDKDSISINKYLFFNNLQEIVAKDKIEIDTIGNNIGFLAIDEQLNNQNFINYIKILYKKMPEVYFTVLYFTDIEKNILKNIFYNEIDRMNFLTPSEIFSGSTDIKVFISSPPEEISNYKNINKNINVVLHEFFKKLPSSTSRQTRSILKKYKLEDIYEYKHYNIEHFISYQIDKTCNAFDFMSYEYLDLLINLDGFIEYIEDVVRTLKVKDYK